MKNVCVYLFSLNTIEQSFYGDDVKLSAAWERWHGHAITEPSHNAKYTSCINRTRITILYSANNQTVDFHSHVNKQCWCWDQWLMLVLVSVSCEWASEWVCVYWGRTAFSLYIWLLFMVLFQLHIYFLIMSAILLEETKRIHVRHIFSECDEEREEK